MKDTTPRGCRLHAQEGLDSGAGCTAKRWTPVTGRWTPVTGVPACRPYRAWRS